MNGEAWAKSGSPSSIAHGSRKIAAAIFLNAINSSESCEELALRRSSDAHSEVERRVVFCLRDGGVTVDPLAIQIDP
jgi:hypothetical protein